MRQKEAERSIQSIPEAEDVSFVMEPGNTAAFDAAKSPPDGRIAAFCKKSFPIILVKCLFCAEHGRQGQKTLIGIIVEKLFFHAGVHRKVDQLVIGIEEQPVFRKPSTIHGVGEGAAAASVIIEGLFQKTGARSFQQAGIDGQPVLSQLEGQGDAEKMFFEKRCAKQFVAEAGRDTKVEKIPRKKHGGKDLFLKPAAVIEPGRTDIPALDVLF